MFPFSYVHFSNYCPWLTDEKLKTISNYYCSDYTNAIPTLYYKIINEKHSAF